MGTSNNIIVGAANVFLGPSVNESTGADIAAKITAWRNGMGAVSAGARWKPSTAAWRDIGYTQDGLEVATDPSWSDVEVDQLLDAAVIFKDGMGLSISTTMAEATLDNMLIAWGQTSSFAQSSASALEVDIEGGNLGQAPLERGLVAVGNGPRSGGNVYSERTYFAYSVLSVDASTTSMSRAEATTIPVTFRALPADNGRYGAVRDRLNVT